MQNNYDRIAGNYEWLSRLVFRNNLILSQTCLLQHIPAGSKVLIAGGGTGWILEEIAKVHESGLAITYVDISEKMILLAKKQSAKNNKVIFINKAIEDYTSPEKFDIIFTPFLFDNFGLQRAGTVFQSLSVKLNDHGRWLFADFAVDKKSRCWLKLLLNLMLMFFRIVCNIEARNLIPMNVFFKENGFKQIHEYHYLQGFIKSSVYIRIRITDTL